MGKRKIYRGTDLNIQQFLHRLDHDDHADVITEVIPPANTRIEYEQNATNRRSFDFARWYGVGINSITFACQRQIERFQAGQDALVRVSTLTAYTTSLTHFLNYLVQLVVAFRRVITLAEIDRDLIDGYIG